MPKQLSITLLFVLSSLLITANAPQQTQAGKLTWWGALLILAAVIVVIALLIIWNARQKATVQAPIEEEAPQVKATPVEMDDLKLIEGIGPKISSLLQTKGIATFAQLAATDSAKLEQILRQANLRIADPSTWPQQATLAAAGKWNDLQALQDDLKGGRVV